MGGRRLASAFGAIVTAVSACGGSSDPTPMPLVATCPSFAAGANRYAALTPAPAVDGLVIADLEGETVTIGAPCTKATSHDACMSAVQAALAQRSQGWSYSLGGPIGSGTGLGHGAATSGDTVTPLVDADGLKSAIAPIDSLDEAAAWLIFSGHYVDCDGKNASLDGTGFRLRSVRSACDGSEDEYIWLVGRDGSITQAEHRQLKSADSSCIEGRRPQGYVGEARPWLATLPAYLAEIAHMEAAAVVAFADLHAALVLYGAPPALVARALDARRDETVHAAIMTRLARAHGAEPAGVARCASATPPTLLALALDNATEGCVREAFGALVARYQARHARLPALRRAFARIARDEAAHAELSLDLATWLEAQLSPAERAVVEAARARAWAELAVEEPSLEVQRDAGMPSARTARALLTSLYDVLQAA